MSLLFLRQRVPVMIVWHDDQFRSVKIYDRLAPKEPWQIDVGTLFCRASAERVVADDFRRKAREQAGNKQRLLDVCRPSSSAE